LTGVGIGLDIGTSAVKLVELLGGNEIRVNSLGMIPLESGLVSAGEVKEPGEVSEAIKSLIHQHNIQSKRVVLAVAGQAAVVRLLKISLQNPNDLSDIVMKEAEKNLPYALNELYMNYQVIKEDPVQKEAEVVLVCTRKPIIDSQMEAVRNAGLEPVAIDIQPLALVRSAGLENVETFGNIGLLDIGEETSVLIIIKDGIPLFTRVIPLAGNRITQLISESIGIPYGSADELKRVYGDLKQDLSQISLDDIDYKVNSMVLKGVKELTAELKRSFEYFYLQQQGETEITTLVVSGGGSKLKNLLPFLNQELNLRVILCPQPENLVCPAEKLMEFNESGLVYNVALGLALREVTEAPRINLLPVERQAKPAVKTAKRTPKVSTAVKPELVDKQPTVTHNSIKKPSYAWIYVILGIFLLGSLIFLLGEYTEYDPALVELTSVHEQWDQYRLDVAKEKQTQKTAPPTVNPQPELALMTHMYRPWLAVIQSLASALPEEVWLTGIEGANEGGIHIKCRSLTVTAAQDYIRNLQGNTLFDSVQLQEMKQVSPGIPDYTFTLEITTGGAMLNASEK
jgi:type IV pilus assembly protein PilM